MITDVPFHSVLFAEPQDSALEAATVPSCFDDLHLDQVVSDIVSGSEEYDLRPLFFAPLKSREDIMYRHEVLRDIEQQPTRSALCTFAAGMKTVRARLSQSEAMRHPLQKQRWFLDAAEVYCTALSELLRALAQAKTTSRGLQAFQAYLTQLLGSEEFESLSLDTVRVREGLSRVHYAVVIRGEKVKVRRYEGETDYSEHVLATFERFKQGVVKDYRVDFPETPQMNHIEERIIELVAQLYPEEFEALDDYCATHLNFMDNTVRRFDREAQFYIAYLSYIEPLREVGLAFSYPEISEDDKGIFADDAFDLALAVKLHAEDKQVVPNGFALGGSERIIVVSGPNQGGKTTFARMFGQLHYLCRLGLLVPGRCTKLFLCDEVFTHFEREEDITAERGKLEDDLLRIHAILSAATSKSVVVMNEIFTSTTLRDAVSLSKRILKQLIQRDVLGVWVTFIDEIASYGPQTVSMMSSVMPDDVNVRTHKIVRQAATGRAYALSIAQKYGLTYDALKERMRP